MKYDLILKYVGSNRIQVIIAIRRSTGLGLREAHTLIKRAPCMIKADLAGREIQDFKARLEQAGATAEIISKADQARTCRKRRLILARRSS